MLSHTVVVQFQFLLEGGMRCLAQANRTFGNTLVLLPTGTIYRGTAETLFFSSGAIELPLVYQGRLDFC